MEGFENTKSNTEYQIIWDKACPAGPVYPGSASLPCTTTAAPRKQQQDRKSLFLLTLWCPWASPSFPPHPHGHGEGPRICCAPPSGSRSPSDLFSAEPNSCLTLWCFRPVSRQRLQEVIPRLPHQPRCHHVSWESTRCDLCTTRPFLQRHSGERQCVETQRIPRPLTRGLKQIFRPAPSPGSHFHFFRKPLALALRQIRKLDTSLIPGTQTPKHTNVKTL